MGQHVHGVGGRSCCRCCCCLPLADRCLGQASMQLLLHGCRRRGWRRACRCGSSRTRLCCSRRRHLHCRGSRCGLLPLCCCCCLLLREVGDQGVEASHEHRALLRVRRVGLVNRLQISVRPGGQGCK